ncbi:hypothetical protein BDZ91DRAFT_647440 [Kalaharituber pfeilii]|nr:hypothetical protein BDZ91DRAFT_647440 [Kalaharituber pfeilii]
MSGIKKGSSGAMQSNVGNPQTYNAGDQKTSKKSQKPNELVVEELQRSAQEAKDPKDQRNISKRLAREERKLKEEKQISQGSKQEDPRMAAWRHGNEPSKGAHLDAQIQQDERE